MMIVLQEAYQKQKDSELELANRKRAESDRELAEERSKNQGLAKQERDLLKLLQQTQEKVVEKSKSSSRAENNKQNYKQKLEEEEERRQVLEKVGATDDRGYTTLLTSHHVTPHCPHLGAQEAEAEGQGLREGDRAAGERAGQGQGRPRPLLFLQAPQWIDSSADTRVCVSCVRAWQGKEPKRKGSTRAAHRLSRAIPAGTASPLAVDEADSFPFSSPFSSSDPTFRRTGKRLGPGRRGESRRLKTTTLFSPSLFLSFSRLLSFSLIERIYILLHALKLLWARLLREALFKGNQPVLLLERLRRQRPTNQTTINEGRGDGGAWGERTWTLPGRMRRRVAMASRAGTPCAAIR
jgi:hypothetical protein